MTDDITIPPEALKTAAASICRDNGWPLSRLNACIPVAHDACLAMLRAWPGSYSLAENDSAVIRNVAAIILPLPKEGAR